MNDSAVIHIKGEKFSELNPREMRLLFRIADERISYAIVNEKDKSLEAVYDAAYSSDSESSFSAIMNEQQYLSSTFSDVTVTVVNAKFTLIPQAYFTREELNNYSKLAQAESNDRTIISSANEQSINCLSAVSLATLAPLSASFPGLRIISQVSPIIEATIGLKGIGKTMLIQFNQNSFEICVADGRKVLLYNFFRTDNEQDFAYFLLAVMAELKIESDIQTFICGNAGAGDARVRLLEKYIQNIQYADITKVLSVPAAFDDLPKHRFFALISTLLCG